jgi:hypothetical protein
LLLSCDPQASIGELQDAPRTTQEGAFGVFAIEGQGAFCRWVVSEKQQEV